MSIESTRQISEIGATGNDSISGISFQAPSSALNRLSGASHGSTGYQVATLAPGDGFHASSSNAHYGGDTSDFANNFAANFLGPADTTSTPGAGRKRRSSGSRHNRRGTRPRTGRHSQSSRARHSNRSNRSHRSGGTRPTSRSHSAGRVPGKTGNPTADAALGMANHSFKRGQTKRCADFVSTMLERTGAAPRGFRHQDSVAGLAKYGKPVSRGNLKPGDVVFFGNTYKKGKYTHTGIYVGNGKFVHRPTANKPVQVGDLNSGYYSSHYTGAHRMH